MLAEAGAESISSVWARSRAAAVGKSITRGPAGTQGHKAQDSACFSGSWMLPAFRVLQRLASPPLPRLDAWFLSGTGGQLPSSSSASSDHRAASGAPGISAGHAVAPGAVAGQPPRSCSQRRGPRQGPRNQQQSRSLCFSDHGFAAVFEFHGPADLTL
uniref:Uncharacterized protein n=1 Tax=Rangifer tarandus platyrhynchus TaxID=3082113 RepID=A0ACB0EM44_RANTA|nr:unnamed protein product [Rangifer tarandus platyrhynchus]